VPNLKDIRKRIKSVESTKQITRTMEMVATAKIRHATERIVKATPYSEAMLEVLDGIAEHASAGDHALLQEHPEVKNVLVVVVASDRGLAGGFNSNVFRMAEKYIMAERQKGAECAVITTGKRAAAYFRYRKIVPVLEFRDMSADPQISHARQIASYAVDAYIKNDVDQVVLCYNHCRNVADQDLVQETLLPINKDMFGAAQAESAADNRSTSTDASAIAAEHDREAKLNEAKEAAKDVSSASELQGAFEYEPGVSEVLNELLPSYVETRLYHALLDSAAGEQGARRKAMKAATDNASDMITTLERVYNNVRQGAITTEITEIVGGAAALEDE
jgi:F-type H+-transporting ATPase subunit gamma